VLEREAHNKTSVCALQQGVRAAQVKPHALFPADEGGGLEQLWRLNR